MERSFTLTEGPGGLREQRPSRGGLQGRVPTAQGGHQGVGKGHRASQVSELTRSLLPSPLFWPLPKTRLQPWQNSRSRAPARCYAFGPVEVPGVWEVQRGTFNFSSLSLGGGLRNSI